MARTRGMQIISLIEPTIFRCTTRTLVTGDWWQREVADSSRRRRPTNGLRGTAKETSND